MKRQKKNGAWGALERTLELPDGILTGGVRMEWTGNRRVVMEGCRRVLEYEEDCIRLETEDGVVRFMGQQLRVDCLITGCAVVTGTVLSLEFL